MSSVPEVLRAAREAAEAASGDLARAGILGAAGARMRRLLQNEERHWAWEMKGGEFGPSRLRRCGPELSRILDRWASRDVRMIDAQGDLLRMWNGERCGVGVLGCGFLSDRSPPAGGVGSPNEISDLPAVLPPFSSPLELADGAGGFLHASDAALSAMERLEMEMFRRSLPSFLVEIVDAAQAARGSWRGAARFVLERQDPWLVLTTDTHGADGPGTRAWRISFEERLRQD